MTVPCTLIGMRTIAYYRVSTDEQAASGNGLDAQRATVARAIAARGWNLVAELTDEGRSGGTMRRPALLDALDRMDRHEADVLIVAKLDRLSRSVLDFASITEAAKIGGWAVVTLDLAIDTTTPTGEMMANITAVVAQWERRIISQRTSEALQAMKARGVRLGGPVTLPADVRTRIATERADGQTFRAIAARLVADGIPTARGGQWHAGTVRAVCTSVALDAFAAVA